MTLRKQLSLILAVAVVLPALVAAALPVLAADNTPVPATATVAVTPGVSGTALAATPGVTATVAVTATRTAAGTSPTITATTILTPAVAPSAALTSTKATTATAGLVLTIGAGPTSSLHVDIGGKGYRDAAGGVTWQADQPYSAAAGWGYVGPKSMQVVAASRPIAGTTISPVYQTQRLGATGYRFNVADGQYRVTVRLAELYVEVAPGANVFAVYCQGTPAVSGIDVMKSVGRYRAYDRTFTCNASGGSLLVTFVPTKGWVAIAGLEVENAAASAAQTPGAGALSASPPAPTATVAITATATLTTAASATVVITPTLVITATKAPAATTTITATTPLTTAISVTPTLPLTPTAVATRPITATAATQTTPLVTPTAAAAPLGTATAQASQTPSAPPTVAPTSSPTSVPATTTPSPAPSQTPSLTPSLTPSATQVLTPVAEATEAPAPPGMQRMSRDGFSVIFEEPDRQGAADVLDALSAVKRRLSEELGLTTAPVEIRLFPNRQAYNEALGTTVPADQVGNIADPGHVWLLAPRTDNPTERDDILKGAQVEIARLALSQIPNLPTWLREGAASYEGRLWNDARQQYLRSLVAMRRITTLRSLDGSSYNYLGGSITAHTVVDYLVKTYGVTQVARLVDALKTKTIDPALQDALGVSFAEVDRGWMQYLNQTFGR